MQIARKSFALLPLMLTACFFSGCCNQRGAASCGTSCSGGFNNPLSLEAQFARIRGVTPGRQGTCSTCNHKVTQCDCGGPGQPGQISVPAINSSQLFPSSINRVGGNGLISRILSNRPGTSLINQPFHSQQPVPLGPIETTGAVASDCGCSGTIVQAPATVETDCGCNQEIVIQNPGYPSESYPQYRILQDERANWVESAPIGTLPAQPVVPQATPAPPANFAPQQIPANPAPAAPAENAGSIFSGQNDDSAGKPEVPVVHSPVETIEPVVEPVVKLAPEPVITPVHEPVTIEPVQPELNLAVEEPKTDVPAVNVSTESVEPYYDAEDQDEVDLTPVFPAEPDLEGTIENFPVIPLPEPAVDRIARAPVEVSEPVETPTIIETVVDAEPEPIVLRARPTESHFISPGSREIIARSHRPATPAMTASSTQRVDEFGLPAGNIEFHPLPQANHPSRMPTMPASLNRNNSFGAGNSPAVENPKADEASAIDLPEIDIEQRIREEVEKRFREMMPQTQPESTEHVPADVVAESSTGPASDGIVLRVSQRSVPQTGQAVIKNVSTGSLPAVIPSTGSMPNLLGPQFRRPVEPQIPFSAEPMIILEELPEIGNENSMEIDPAIERRLNGLSELPTAAESVQKLLER